MKGIVAIAFAALFALPLVAAADEATGKVREIDRMGGTVVLQDGTRLSMDEGRLADLQPGENVRATYETKGGQLVVTDLNRETATESRFIVRTPLFQNHPTDHIEAE